MAGMKDLVRGMAESMSPPVELSVYSELRRRTAPSQAMSSRSFAE